jgi:hypothetical protein
MAIQSDVQNGDGRLTVVFYKKTLQNSFKTSVEGRPIFDEVDMVKIYTGGDTLNIVDTFVREDHKARFPQQWAHYLNRTGNDPHISGTPLEHWPLISKAQAEELKALKFFTVENVANASDAQLQRIGMLAGMSAHSFRDRAVNFLKLAKEEANVNQHEEEINQLRSENAKIKAETDAKLAEMQAQMANILAAVGEKKSRGRKPKDEEPAEV